MRVWKVSICVASLFIGIAATACGDDSGDGENGGESNQETTNQGDPENNDNGGEQGVGEVLFSMEDEFNTGPALGPGELIYVTSDERSDESGLFAIETDGDVAWSYTEGFRTYMPTVDIERDRLFVGNRDNNRIWAMAPLTGEDEWVEIWDAALMSAIDAEGNIYGLTEGASNFVNSRATNGDRRWGREYGVNFSDYPHPAISDEYGGLYVAMMDGHLKALDLENGEELWEVEVNAGGNRVRSAPAIVEDTLFIGSPAGLQAIDLEEGEVRWVFDDFAGTGHGDVVVSPDGETIYFHSASSAPNEHSVLIAVDRDGEEVWQGATTFWRRSAKPLVAQDGTIYVAFLSGLSAIEPQSGEEIWTLDLDEEFEAERITGSPVMGDDGTLYLTVNDSDSDLGQLIAVPTPASGISETSPWATVGADQQRTGRAR